MNGERAAGIKSLGAIAVRLAIVANRGDVPAGVAAELRRLAGDVAEHGDAREKFVLRTGGAH